MRSTIVVLFILFGSHKFNEGNIRLLFIGNSLTYTNDLPELVEQHAKDLGVRIKTKMVALPNYALIDHWDDGYIQELIESDKFDFVIVQQGPSSQPEGRKMLIEDGALLADICRKHDAKFVYFMVWPSRMYYQTFDRVIKNYSDAADQNNAILCPVGEVWKNHFDQTGDFSYYGQDGFHPSLKGSRAAANVIVNTLFNE